MRQAVVTCRRGTSVARSLKLLALPYSNDYKLLTNITVTYSSSCYWWVTLYNQYWLVVKYTVNYRAARFSNRRDSLVQGYYMRLYEMDPGDTVLP